MKLFKVEVKFKQRRQGRAGAEVVVHARSRAAAEKHLEKKFTGCELVSVLELKDTPKHFVVADVVV